MKKAVAILGSITLVGVLVWIIWFVGIVLEFEYPYTFTLMRVRNAISVNGTPVSKIIAADGADWSRGLNWHTCSYCAYWCGDHKNLISVHLEAPDKRTTYYFAYCYTTRTLVPMTDKTASHFPSLVPIDDSLEGVNQLNGKAGRMSVGAGDLKLPAKWFRKVTNAEQGAAAPNLEGSFERSARSARNLKAKGTKTL